MVDGVHGHHAQQHVVVALKPASVHVPHPPMVVPRAQAPAHKPAIHKHVLNHVLLAHIHPLACTLLV